MLMADSSMKRKAQDMLKPAMTEGGSESNMPNNSKRMESLPVVTEAVVLIDVKFQSGETLARVSMPLSAMGLELKQTLRAHLTPGTRVQELLLWEQPIEDSKMLGDLCLSSGATVHAIIAAEPTVYLFEPCSAEELSERYGEWLGAAVDDIMKTDVNHLDMKDAPPIAKGIAEKLQGVFGSALKDYRDLYGNANYHHGAEVIVIANPGLDAKSACLRALAFKMTSEMFLDQQPKVESIHDLAWLKTRDLSSHLEQGRGFNWDPTYTEADPDSERALDSNHFQHILAGTRVMADSLTDHFAIGFDAANNDFIFEEPRLCGGYASDGNIVAVLSARHWD